MLLIGLLFKSIFSIKSNKETNENKSCPGPNSVLDWNGDCVCEDGFPYGDPKLEKGCYVCPSMCHKLAYCEYPGKCICNKPFQGDGIQTCSTESPKLIDFSPKHGPPNGGTEVTITFSYSNYILNSSSKTEEEKLNKNVSALCKFGPLIVRSEKVIDDTHLVCLSPPRRTKAVSLSISFDTFSWSKEDVFFAYKSAKALPARRTATPAKKKRNFVVMALVCLVLLFGLFFLSIKESTQTELPHALERKNKGKDGSTNKRKTAKNKYSFNQMKNV